MSQVHETIDARLGRFLLAQPVFFVGTAPLAVGGRVNVSPRARGQKASALPET
jgi:hypothetical protein